MERISPFHGDFSRALYTTFSHPTPLLNGTSMAPPPPKQQAATAQINPQRVKNARKPACHFTASAIIDCRYDDHWFTPLPTTSTMVVYPSLMNR